jgi:hypothetical protein
MNVDRDTDFWLSKLGPEFGSDLPPIVVIATSGGAWHLQTYWTPDQAREFAADLVAMAEEVE